MIRIYTRNERGERPVSPEMFGREVAKMPSGTRVVATHIKVRYREQVIQELHDLKLPNLVIGECETDYGF